MTLIINLLLIFFGTSLAIMTSRFPFFNIPYFHTFFTTIYIILIIFVLYRCYKQGKSYLKYLTLSFLPVYIVLFIIFNILNSNIKQVTLAIISFGLFISFIYLIKKLLSNISQKPKKDFAFIKTFKKLEIFTIFILTLIFFTTSLNGISKQALVDEPLWMFNHVEKYSNKIIEGDLRHSTPHDKPGVPVAILSSVALLKYPNPSEIKKNISPSEYIDLATRMRIPIVIFASLILPLFYLILRQLFNSKVSILSYASISLSPILIGFTRTINPDALLWILLPLSLLFFLLSIHTNNRKIIIITGILFGLAILTKYIANILFIFFILVIFIHLSLTSKKRISLLNLKKSLKTYFTISLIAIFLTFILLPATWVYPKSLLTRTFWSQAFEPIWLPFIIFIALLLYDIFIHKNSIILKILNIISTYKKIIISSFSYLFILNIIFIIFSSQTNSFFDYQLSITSPKSSVTNIGFLGTFFGSFYVLFYGIFILSLIGFISTLFFIKKEKSTFIQASLLSLSIFIPFYYIGSTISGVSSIIRYQIALYPIAFIISGYGLYKLSLYFNKKYFPALTLLYAGLLIISLWQVSPYYQSYNNIILPKKNILNIKDMGDGSYQAAQYLNNLNNAKNLTIWSDKNGVCSIFIGNCTSSVELQKLTKKNIKFDYFVTSSTKKNLITRKFNRELRRSNVPTNPIIFTNLYKKNIYAEHEIILGLNNFNKIKIINAKDIIMTKK